MSRQPLGDGLAGGGVDLGQGGGGAGGALWRVRPHICGVHLPQIGKLVRQHPALQQCCQWVWNMCDM